MRHAHSSVPRAGLDCATNVRHFERARLLWQNDEIDAADRLLSQILAAQPGYLDAALLHARLLQGQGRLDAASGAIDNLCRNANLDAANFLRCIQFVRQCQRQPLAARLCELAFARAVVTADLHALCGMIHRELGQFDAARHQFQQALDAGVDLNAWFVLGALASIQRYEDAAHPDFERLHAHFHDVNFSERARAASAFGLAKACDDIGDYARAASTLRSANVCARAAQPWRRIDWDRWVDQRVQPGRAIAPSSADGDGRFAPVFVVGLPRSGTTLTALQFAGHADVRVRGELPHIPYIASRLDASGRSKDPAALHEAARLYAAHMRQDDAPARWHLDGNQMNFRHLDLIARLFPQARVIHCVRERRDAALSQWSQFFAHDDCAFANRWEDIAAFCAGHDRLMRHWAEQLDLPIHTVVYEDLIADPARARTGLEQFLGLSAQPVHDRNGRPGHAVTSSSVWQARQPIHGASVGRWKNYRPYVPELVAIANGWPT